MDIGSCWHCMKDPYSLRLAQLLTRPHAHPLMCITVPVQDCHSLCFMKCIPPTP